MSNEELVSQIQNNINARCNMELLYNQNKPYILKVVKRYAFNGDIEDLMQEAYFGLYDAAKRYEDTHEIKFITYAAYWIRQSITRYLENNGDIVRLPVGFHGMVHQYKRLIDSYEKEMNRKPTDREMCRCLNIGIKTLENLKATIHSFGSLDSLEREIQSEDSTLCIGDTIADKMDLENESIDRMMNKSLHTELWQIVKENTTETENHIINDRFKKNLTLAKTGQELGITIEAVRQWEAKGLRKLRRPRVRKILIEKFEVNNSKLYRGGWSNFRDTGSSIVESIAIKNLELNAK